mgnify:CR=1 FL=1
MTNKEKYVQLLNDLMTAIEEVQAHELTEYGSDFDRMLSDIIYEIDNEIEKHK